MGGLGVLSTNLFGAYRYRTWNGSLGETDINAAYGVYAQTKGSWSTGEVDHIYLIRGAVGDYDADRFNSNRLFAQWAGQLFRLHHQQDSFAGGKTAELIPTAAYRYSPSPHRSGAEPEHECQHLDCCVRRWPSPGDPESQRRPHHHPGHLQQALP